MAERITISVERVRHSGALILSAIVGGYLVRRTYYGYGVRESRRLFREFLAERA
jgi:hypothetical protein